MRRGKAYRTIQRQREINPNRPLPEEFKNPPEINNFIIFYWDLFWELSTERKVESGPIPGSAIIKYSKLFNIDYDDLNMIIRSMDNEYMQYLQEERDKKTNQRSTKNTSTIEDRISRTRK